MSNITMRDMFKAGVHYGHQKRYWNPKMSPFIYGAHNKIHIINLEKTFPMYQEAVNFVGSVASKGGKILFVGTKKSAQKVTREQAESAGMPFVNHRWLGGMLTNYKTVRQSIKRLRELEKMKEDGRFDRVTKKEGLRLERELIKLDRSLGGIKHMGGLPDAIVLIDSAVEKIAIQEANRLSIPVIGVVDTNGCPDGIDYLIPGNDDAIRAIDLYFGGFSKAISDAREVIRAESAGKEEVQESDALKAKPKKAADAPKKVVKKPAPKAEAEAEEKPAKKAAPKKAVKTEVEAPAEKKDAKPAAKEDKPAKEAKAEKKEAKKAPAKKPAAKKAASEDKAEKKEAKKAAPKKAAAKKADSED